LESNTERGEKRNRGKNRLKVGSIRSEREGGEGGEREKRGRKRGRRGGEPTLTVRNRHA